MFRSHGIQPSLILAGLALIMVLFQFSPAWSEDPAPANGAPAPAGGDSAPEFVSIDFNNVDINVFIKFISRLTGKNFVIDNRVKGNVTIISPTKISVQEAYRVFISVLDINGYSTVESGNVTKIVPSTEARTDNVDTGMLNKSETPVDKMVTRIVRLHYASSDELRSLLAPLVPKGSVLLSYSDTNMLIITATLASIDRLIRIVDTIDVESIGRTISVLPVKNADAAKVVKILTNIYTTQTRRSSKSKGSQDETVKMEADDRTNSIVLLASELETQRISSLIEMLDQEVPRGEERIRVYYLEHATAEDLAGVLQEIPTKSTGNNKQTGQKTTPLLSDDIKITADKATNSLIIIADKDDYPVIEEVIKKLYGRDDDPGKLKIGIGKR
jgi:general secretion pathway protein D